MLPFEQWLCLVMTQCLQVPNVHLSTHVFTTTQCWTFDQQILDNMICLQSLVLDMITKIPKTFQYSLCVLVALFGPLFWMLWSGCWVPPMFPLMSSGWCVLSDCVLVVMLFSGFVLFAVSWLLCHLWLCFSCCLLSSYVLTVEWSVHLQYALVGEFCPAYFCLLCSGCCLDLFSLAVF